MREKTGMPRLPSTFALSGWLGFVASSAVMLAIRHSPFGGAANVPAPALSSTSLSADGPLISADLAVGVLLVTSLVFLHGKRPRRRSAGERLGLVALGSIAVLALVAAAGGWHPFPAGHTTAPFWTFLVIAALAIAFDRLVAEEPGEDDGDAFEAGVKCIAEAMARQTRLYAPRALREQGGRRGEEPSQ